LPLSISPFLPLLTAASQRLVNRWLISAIAVLAVFVMMPFDARTLDETKYPDLKGQWVRPEGARGVARFDPTKPPGLKQEAPLIPEYQAIYEANLKDQAEGGQGVDLDKADPNLLHDEITTIDNALTRPWVVVKNYRRFTTSKPTWWREDNCPENNVHVIIGKDDYFLRAGLPDADKDQPSPHLRYFNQSQK
jgi:hypothetical protein